jgi:hypothetical protein
MEWKQIAWNARGDADARVSDRMSNTVRLDA